MSINKYTLTQFKEAYPNDDACLDKIFQLRFKNLIFPKCENDKPFKRVNERRSYQCTVCGYQIYPTKDTVFQKSTTPLTYWFMAIFLQTTTRNGVSAKELERALEVSYPTALRMNHQIKLLIAKKKPNEVKGKIVQIDESYFGMKLKNMHNKQRKERNEAGETHLDNKTVVMGFVSDTNEVKFEVLDSSKSYKERVKETVSKDTTIVTDSHAAYTGLNLHYIKHEVVNHIANEFVKNGYHTNSVENAWSILKRTIGGTHVHVSRKHLQKYVDEVAFRLMYRNKQHEMFEKILSHIA